MTSLDGLPPLRDVIQTYDLAARKRLGQNFLLDLNLTAKIAARVFRLAKSTAKPNTETGFDVLEIGSGPGGLTRALLTEGAHHVTAIETDPRCLTALQPLVEAAAGRLTLIEGDALEFDYAGWIAGCRTPPVIAANLPYNISTPLLLRLLEHASGVAAMGLMFQREVADRILAPPNSKTRGRLSVMSQWRCQTHKLLSLPPHAFTPKPKISSTVVGFVPQIHRSEDQIAFLEMETTVRAAFGQRRKMLRQSLTSLCGANTDAILNQAEIDPRRRAETLSTQEFLTLARQIYSVGSNGSASAIS